MNLKFEVEDMILRQKKTSSNHNSDLDNLFCSFVFTTPNWKHIEKYAIFWNRKGKSTIRYIGKGMKETCELPETVLNDLYFYVQVYANEDIFTQKQKVFLLKDIEKEKKPQYRCYTEKEKIKDFFKENGKNIDNIIYDNGNFLIYSNNKLIKTIDVVDEKLIARLLHGLTPKLIFDTALNENSDLPISCKLVYQALKNKVDLTDLPLVAVTGKYEDLEDIPSEFPPSEHTHQSNDIEDWTDSIEEDFDDFIDNLILKL